MDQIVIDGVRPYDGAYDFDIAERELTTREWGWIKRLSGYLPLTIEEGLSDPELIIVFATIALHRAGKVESRDVPAAFETLSDAPFGSAVKLETEPAVETDEVEGVRPPPPSSSENSVSSGPGSKTNSETSLPPPKRFGMPDSATAESVSARSAT